MASGPFPPVNGIGDGTGFKQPPSQVDPGVFYGGGKAKALGTIDVALKAVQAMKTRQWNEGYKNAQRQYQVADAYVQSVWAQHVQRPDDPIVAEALKKAMADRSVAYDEMMNYGTGGAKGKGKGKQGSDGQQQPQSMAQKVGTYLRNVLTGPPRSGGSQYPTSKPPMSTPPFNPVPAGQVQGGTSAGLQPLPMQFAGMQNQGPQVGQQATVDGQPVIVRGIHGNMVDVEPLPAQGGGAAPPSM